MITLTLGKDGSAYFVAEGLYPQCTDPHQSHQGWGDTPQEAFNEFVETANFDI